jgi:hypothetical protein
VIDTEGRVAIAKFPAVGSTYGMPRLGKAWRSAVECKILKVEIEQMAPAFGTPNRRSLGLSRAATRTSARPALTPDPDRRDGKRE